MLIIPVSRTPDWRRPPLITLILIVVNCLIYFGLQGGDDKRQEKALAYYAESTLPDTEFPRYIDYLKKERDNRAAQRAERAFAAKNLPILLSAMEGDSRFMQRLRAGEIIKPADSGYAAWKAQRERFDRMMGATMLARFGFRPAEPTLAGLFGHMFLHGSFDHLLGNMAILFIVGYIVEEALGKRRYLAFYLLSGLGAAALDFVVNSDRIVPGIGASGAISGVMAMFVTLYGMQRIRFFYWLFIYFDFVRAPAILILPLWIANELYQFYFNHGSPINYMAHLGGFVTGAILVYAWKHRRQTPVALPEQEKVVDPVPAELDRIEKLLSSLRLEEATTALRRLARAHPDNHTIVGRYFKVARTAPASEDFHLAAAMVFALPDDQGVLGELLHECYNDYLKLAKPSVRFSSSQLATLVRRLARHGYADDAERLARVLSKRKPDHPNLPDLLLAVSESFRKKGNLARHQELLEYIRNEFPDSSTAEVAAKLYG